MSATVELTFAKYVTETYMASVHIDPNHFREQVGETLAEAGIEEIRAYCLDHDIAHSEHLTHTDDVWDDPTIVH